MLKGKQRLPTCAEMYWPAVGVSTLSDSTPCIRFTVCTGVERSSQSRKSALALSRTAGNKGGGGGGGGASAASPTNPKGHCINAHRWQAELRCRPHRRERRRIRGGRDAQQAAGRQRNGVEIGLEVRRHQRPLAQHGPGTQLQLKVLSACPGAKVKQPLTWQKHAQFKIVLRSNTETQIRDQGALL